MEQHFFGTFLALLVAVVADDQSLFQKIGLQLAKSNAQSLKVRLPQKLDLPFLHSR
jgi:hypothetical protein